MDDYEIQKLRIARLRRYMHCGPRPSWAHAGRLLPGMEPLPRLREHIAEAETRVEYGWERVAAGVAGGERGDEAIISLARAIENLKSLRRELDRRTGRSSP